MTEQEELRGGWLVLAAMRFAAELGLLAGLGYVGWRIAEGNQALGVVLAVAGVSLAGAVWGRWVAPRAQGRLEDPARLLVELTLFTTAVVALALLEAWGAASVLGLAYLVSTPVGRRGH